MSWQQINVTTQSEAVEAVSNILMEAGAQGIQIEDSADVENFTSNDATVFLDWNEIDHLTEGAKVAGFFASETNLTELVLEIQQKVQRLVDFGLNSLPGTVELVGVAEEDWATEWQKYYHPLRVTRYLTVVPDWEEYQPSDIREHQIVLDPGMAFGTGTHPTTQLMLQALETVIRGEESVLDVGTGSGVLAIAAKLLGASKVLATDIDEVAVQSARDNIDLNPAVAADIEIVASDLLAAVPAKPFDLIVANMLAEVLELLIPNIKPYLAAEGKILLSGIYYDKLDKISQLLEANGYQLDEQMRLGDWYGLIASKVVAEEN
ncbi:50S ribosomal protein L11 [Weissella oryzae SG25]|uniref:Ribosomal protein L11 methyltransferase n=1 Tax=Weissella oryzae (strain DSM 25784 / JCM 18191 / LMG 30913 / SG25) TaxID=1329250 RepID=A0A069CZU9_WEIOS|nr:50S ribosomal protein L11 methyltransferase [Weissella oryzae]GAK30626.1 50S ribosomal protein L11 [Weissella oryzae SG25]